MSFTKSWDESTPQGTDPHSVVDDKIREFKYAIRERLAVQHKFYDNESGHSDVGEHKPGECSVMYIGTKATFPTPTSTQDGCIAYATDEKKWYYYDTSTSSWEEVELTGMSGIVFTSGNQTINGVKTFGSIPVLPASDPSNDNEATRKKYIDDKFDTSTGHDHDGTDSKRLDANGISGVLGSWVSKSFDTVYQAATDGFVVAYAGPFQESSLVGYTDSNNPPTTVRAKDGEGEYGSASRASITMPVRKGDYWKVKSPSNHVSGYEGKVYWIPLGV